MVVWEVEVEQIGGDFKRNWRVICRNCNAQGPWGGTGEGGKYNAAERWRNRVTLDDKGNPNGNATSGKPPSAAG